MASISIATLPQSGVLYLYTMRDEMQMDPPYQRQSDIWSLSKRQLLIDSILNSFDIPKFYLHKLPKAVEVDGHELRTAIVDGKQRLEAVWDFIDGEFALADGFQYLEDEAVELSGLTYQELGKKYPKIKSRFDATSLSIIQVETSDIELIEEMFSRLNEAVPLTAAEKRNAFGGPVPPVIREVARHNFFVSRLPFSNSRYRHYDLSCKFLLLAGEPAITDTKKIHLDNFVKGLKAKALENEPKAYEKVKELEVAVQALLDKMAKVFVGDDALLMSVGMVVVYFCLFLYKPEAADKCDRTLAIRFENVRKLNRDLAKAEDEENPPSYTLLEFDRLMQAPNDASSIRFKVDLLEKYLLGGAPQDVKAAIDLL
ncbi:MAG: DUF262 domain-containing protein [Fimbriimonadaceae bacterium]